MMHNLDAILFDLDGTLVETIHLYEEAMIHTFAHYGITLTHESFLALYHRGTGIETLLREHLGQDADVSDARRHRDAAYVELLRTRSSWLPGAENLLSKTAQMPRAVVTKSWQHYVDAIDEALGVSLHISAMVTANEMQPYFKPHPHGFLLAADMLGVAPDRCLVVGDQLFDIEAAKDGGMRSYLIIGPHTPPEAHTIADAYGPSLDALSQFLGLVC